MRNKILPILALLGLVIAIISIFFGNKENTSPLPAISATKAPFEEFIAGGGLIESSTENIAIGTPVSGIVSNIYVKIGDKVKQDEPLFKIDTLDLEAELLPAIATIDEKKALLGNAKIDYKLTENSREAISKEILSEKKFDVDIAKANFEKATAEVERLNIEISRRTITSPIDGKILQIKTHLGEFANSYIVTKPPLMILGGTDSLHVRADIDEYDAWRFDKEQPAFAFVRGRSNIKIPLKFVRVEPYVIPKKSLTGNSTERTDTRVLQVIYSLKPKSNLYIGQQLDIYIKAPMKVK